MSTMRCPMCGKQNPVEAEKCQFCGARLRPVIPSSPAIPPLSRDDAPQARDASPSPEPRKEGQDDMGWLRDLSSPDAPASQAPAGPEPSGEASPANSGAEAEPAAGEDSPAWLERIRTRSKQEPEAISPIGRNPLESPPPDAEPTPPEAGHAPLEAGDWLQDLRPSDEPPASTPAGESQPPAGEPENEDWLTTFNKRMGTPADSPQEEPPAGPAEPAQPIELPDWLKAIGGFEALESSLPPDQQPIAEIKPPAPQEPAGHAPPEPAGPIPPAEPPQAPIPGEALPAEEVPDWLKDLGVSVPPAAAPSAVPTAETPAEQPPEAISATPEAVPAEGEITPSEAGLPAWLSELAPADQAAAEPPAEIPAALEPAAPEVEPAEVGQPAWLSEMETPQEAAAETPAALEAQGVESQPAEAGIPVETGLPAWLAEASTAPAESQAEPAGEPEAADLSAWLASQEGTVPQVRDEFATPPAEEPGAEAATPAEMPDWLKRMSTGPLTEPASGLPGETPLPEGLAPLEAGLAPLEEESLDWLAAYKSEQAGTPQAGGISQPVSPGAESAPAEGVPPAETPPAAFVEGEPLEGEPVPDWLKDINAGQAVPPERDAFAIPPERETSATPGQAVPDWLGDFASASNAEQPPIEGAGPQEGVPEAAAAEDIPDWLRTISPQAETAAEAGLPSVSPFSEEGLPSWMNEGPLPAEQSSGRLIDRSADELASGPAHPFASEELPDWLNKPEGAEEPAPAGAPVEEPAAAEAIEQAQLPAWLQAMRPIESATPEAMPQADEQRVEKYGPLAGLRGILPGEEMVTSYRKPPIYSAKLHVSEKQQDHAALLEGLLGSEAAPQEVPSAPTQAPQYFVRLTAAVALIALLLVVLLSGLRPLLPASLSAVDPQVILVNKLVNDLPQGAPVLVAVEYEAGLQGELRTAALPVLRHLMSRQVRLVLISTNPLGPLLGEQLVTEAAAGSSPPFKADLQKANLGYLVGGSTGIKQLALPPAIYSGQLQPLRLAAPLTWTEKGDGWGYLPALQGLNQLSDFKLILVLTDNPETGRAWVEQTRPENGSNLPLVMISSAQAAPLLRPYQASGQVRSLISGLAGGAAYEQLRQSPGVGTTYWNAYQAGILAAVLFILMGAVVTMIATLTRRTASRRPATK